MAKKAPHRRTPTAPDTVWALQQKQGLLTVLVGHYLTEEKAQAQAERLIAQQCGVRSLPRLPDWAPNVTGGHQLIYGRDDKSWHFVVEPHAVDTEAA